MDKIYRMATIGHYVAKHVDVMISSKEQYTSASVLVQFFQSHKNEFTH